MYVATDTGGASDCGGVYAFDPPSVPGAPWQESAVYSFPPPIGPDPFALIAGPGDVLYVGTYSGGDAENGALFKLTPPTQPAGPWTGALVYSFPAGSAEGYPTSLTPGPGGIFYGTISFGGTAEAGAVFELDPPTEPGAAWTETILYNFSGGSDGSTPNSLTFADDGTLYGTTFGTALNTLIIDGSSPQARGVGTVFKLTPPPLPGAIWTKTTLAQLSAGIDQGPDSPVVLRNGKLYGTSTSSANSYGGVAFELAPPATEGGAWTVTYLHVFDGVAPEGTLVVDQDGTIYGAAVGPVTQASAGIVYEVATN